ncbi:protease inhibitor I42 family protein [Patescibacteria group bacterium]|nr:protease inhibitor I42 family protein [Patescibacteria group bacterium]
MKKFIWLLPILILAGCGGPKLQQITMVDNKQNHNITEGNSFQIVLPSNQTTGYKWELVDLTSGVLEKVKEDYKVSTKYSEGVVGAGGEEIWTFKVLKDERSHIVMEYRRPWDKSEVANNFMVTINGNPGDDGFLTYFGAIKSAPDDSAYDDYFVSEDGTEFGLMPYKIDYIADPGIKSRIAEFTDKDTRLEVRGELVEDKAEHQGKKLIIHEIRERELSSRVGRTLLKI